MKHVFYILCGLLVLSSCKKEEETYNSYDLDTHVEISVKNSKGKDLLDPNNPEAFKKNNIKLFYVKDGIAKEVFDGNLDFPRHFMVYKHESEHRIRIFPDDSEELTTTLIQWEPDNVDTLKCKIKKTAGAKVCIKAWFNDSLRWEMSMGKERYFTIVK